MLNKFIKIEKQRRSIYNLGHQNLNVDPEEIIELIKNAVKYAPTPFNDQSVRSVILFNGSHRKVWTFLQNYLQKKLGRIKYRIIAGPNIKRFLNAEGTILFYIDKNQVNKDIKRYSSFSKDSFRQWAEQAQGNAQFAVWTALAEDKVGASVHHYGDLYGSKVAKSIDKMFNIPNNWILRSEMVFGSIEKPALKKTFIPDEHRFKIFK